MSTNLKNENVGLKRRRIKNPDVKHYLIMLVPAFIWLILFQIVPMFGIVIAFQDFNPGAGFLRSEFVGLEHFQYMFELSDSRVALKNTVIIAIGKITGNLLVPLVFALMLNELRQKYLVKMIQTSVYLPYFLSWVILSGIMLQIFSFNGPINKLLEFMGLEPLLFFQNADLFRGFIIGSDVWKGFGFNAIIYLAALAGIDNTLYEAAVMDGAGRWRKLWHVTLPSIRSTIALLAILSLGGILDAGFDQVYNLYNPLVYSTGDIIDTFVYRAGLQGLDFSFGTAVGLLKSVVSFILITSGYWLAKKLLGYRIF
ncbi:putative aldouronate transport system permease protein [Paenibacillus prosopidis]|uniref:Putative aldouronate transport system permease protein n=2 Tax=Paenibacillus prosopidis TaxID=630520 RepID=A0A368VNI5_9BACL|nr:putative aldouronate transport system permease protein [Paenibacillus prosopidis]